MSGVVHWKLYAVRDPLGSRYLGVAVCKGTEGQEATLSTVDAFANMETHGEAADAEAAIREVLQALMRLRVNRSHPSAEPGRDRDERPRRNRPDDEAL